MGRKLKNGKKEYLSGRPAFLIRQILLQVAELCKR